MLIRKISATMVENKQKYHAIFPTKKPENK